jgi:hypothetical protein
MKKAYSEQDMAKLIAEVETEFKDYLAKAEPTVEVAKTEPVVEEPTEIAYDEQDIEEVNKLYSSMTKNEQEIHFSALKKVFLGDEKEIVQPEPAKEPAKVDEPVAKAEVEKVETLAKSEVDLLKKENEELKKNFEILTSAVTKMVKKVPAQKAITKMVDFEYMKKSEEKIPEPTKPDFSKLSKSELNAILCSKIRAGSITKSEDVENINKFCYNEVSFDTIKHLL